MTEENVFNMESLATDSREAYRHFYVLARALEHGDYDIARDTIEHLETELENL